MTYHSFHLKGIRTVRLMEITDKLAVERLCERLSRTRCHPHSAHHEKVARSTHHVSPRAARGAGEKAVTPQSCTHACDHR